MRPTPVQDRRPGTSADVPDVPSPTSMQRHMILISLPATIIKLKESFMNNAGFVDGPSFEKGKAKMAKRHRQKHTG